MPSTLYEDLGGEKPLRALVDRFYDVMDDLPEAAILRGLHQDDLTDARQKLFEFLSGWMGGPDLYIQKHGHPRLRARHLPFKIGVSERDEWLLCMDQALGGAGIGREQHRQLLAGFSQVADFMRNQEGAADG
jgi:hemoglobin